MNNQINQENQARSAMFKINYLCSSVSSVVERNMKLSLSFFVFVSQR